jgi:hypothetical protein
VDYKFFFGKGNENHQLGTAFLVYHIVVSVVKRVVVSNRVSYTLVMTGRRCNSIVLNVHAPSEEKNDDSKDSSYEELEQGFDHFHKYNMKIILGDFNANVGSENIFKLTNWVIKSRRMSWAGHVALMRKRKIHGFGGET